MIEIKITGEDYEQDIRPLVKAFYPDDTLVLSGHGDQTTIGDEKQYNPYV